jgi:hypothetical protein
VRSAVAASQTDRSSLRTAEQNDRIERKDAYEMWGRCNRSSRPDSNFGLTDGLCPLTAKELYLTPIASSLRKRVLLNLKESAGIWIP